MRYRRLSGGALKASGVAAQTCLHQQQSCPHADMRAQAPAFERFRKSRGEEGALNDVAARNDLWSMRRCIDSEVPTTRWRLLFTRRLAG